MFLRLSGFHSSLFHRDACLHVSHLLFFLHGSTVSALLDCSMSVFSCESGANLWIYFLYGTLSRKETAEMRREDRYWQKFITFLQMWWNMFVNLMTHWVKWKPKNALLNTFMGCKSKVKTTIKTFTYFYFFYIVIIKCLSVYAITRNHFLVNDRLYKKKGLKTSVPQAPSEKEWNSDSINRGVLKLSHDICAYCFIDLKDRKRRQ